MFKSIAAALNAWWERNVVADAETSARLAIVDLELSVIEGKQPIEVFETALAAYKAARS
jgi:hypothetical protein